jgi:hypothetical protein
MRRYPDQTMGVANDATLGMAMVELRTDDQAEGQPSNRSAKQMNDKIVRLRNQFATLKGFCQSATTLSEYNVPTAWIISLISHAENCEELIEEIYNRPGGE